MAAKKKLTAAQKYDRGRSKKRGETVKQWKARRKRETMAIVRQSTKKRKATSVKARRTRNVPIKALRKADGGVPGINYLIRLLEDEGFRVTENAKK